NTKSKFESYLGDFSNSSGRMDELYSAILSRIHEDDQVWVREVLQWVIATETSLEVEELAAAVEWSLGDERDDFKQFLQVQCGSLVRIPPRPWGRKTVHLIHETFRAFLLDPEKGHPKWRINEATIHAHIALKCM